MRYIKVMAIVAAALALCACKSNKGRNLLPNVSGKAGEILVVIERAQWEGDLGTSIREVLADDTPYLAQREPLFNVSNVPPGSFNSMFKMHRNLLLVNINPQNATSGILYKSNQWARPQALVQINAATEEEATELFRGSSAIIAEFFEQSERDRIIDNSKLYEEKKLREPLQDLTGGILHFPSGYQLKKWTDSFVWVADEKQYTTQAVMAYKFPVRRDPFSVANLVAERDSVMQANVPGMFEGSYMTTATAVEPTARSLKYKGREFMELRGFWEVHGDFMGGPFVSHAFYSPDGKEIIVLESFVYAPRYDKRQYLRQVESILYSFEWKKDEK
ncbi:MAG: DUF4837 family protein [Bacteroidales bacterium]|jgi:hypothetical protein|nr:DUF4837 family protein [Bacteroidales bacterium]MBP5676075.1 DUF4837 family protein [Bacteroidales bacterium]